MFFVYAIKYAKASHASLQFAVQTCKNIIFPLYFLSCKNMIFHSLPKSPNIQLFTSHFAVDPKAPGTVDQVEK